MPSPREILLCHYHYDPLDRLISHSLPDTPERRRFYCTGRLATEVQGEMHCSIVQHGDQLLAEQRTEGDVADNRLLGTDQSRSVLQSFTVNCPPQPIAYSPYGHRSIERESMSLLLFNGERPDPVTRHYLLGNGYRAFNSVLMRFNSPDRLSPFGRGGLNSYAYCLGDPINLSDPDGTAGIAKFASNIYWSARKKMNQLLPSRQHAGKSLTKKTITGPIYQIDYETLTVTTSNTDTFKTTHTSFSHWRRTYNNNGRSQVPQRKASMYIVEPMRPTLAELALTKINNFEPSLSSLKQEYFGELSKLAMPSSDFESNSFFNAFSREKYSLEMNTFYFHRGRVDLAPMYNRMLRQAQSDSLSIRSSIHTLSPVPSPYRLEYR